MARVAGRAQRFGVAAFVVAFIADVITFGSHGIPVVEAAGATYGTPSEFTMGCCLAGGGSPFYPHETAIIDVNHDGIPDYLVANSFTVALDVHLGRGDGTFAPTASYAVSGQPIGLAVGDLTNNGIQDVVVADGGTAGNHTYTVLLGNGDGTFRLGGTYSIAYQVNDVELGDLNGDGKLDLVITSASGEIAVLFGNGDGTFGTPTYYATHGGAQTSTIADLNGDEHPDVVVAEGNPPGADPATIGVFLNNGNGALAARVGYNIGNTYATSVNIAVGDINGDGAPDLAVSDGNCGFDPGHVEVLLNNGAGAFVDKGSLSDGCTSDVALTDATGSGHLDAVSVNYGPNGSRVSVYPGNGDGTFGTRVDYPPPDPNTQYRTFAVGDLNRGAKPDVIMASGGNNNTGVNPIAAVYLNITSGPFVPVGGAVTTAESKSPCLACMAQLFTRSAHADPVDTVDGTFSEQYGDLMVPGRGFPLMFARTYNSWAAGTNGPLGYGWTSSYKASLSQNSTTGTVTVTQENGSQVTFGQAGSGSSATYAPTAPRTIAALVHNGDGSWTFTRKASETLQFSSAGMLAKLTDRNGYSTILTYNASNQLTQVADPASRALTLAYTGSQLSSVTDSAGRVVKYAYNDGLGNLTDVTDVNNGNTHFTYDTGHHLLTIRDPRGNTVTTNHYDANNRVDYQLDGLNQKTSFTYATDGSYTVTTDPIGNQIKETFSSGVRTAITRGYGTAQSATWSFTYDPYTLGVIGVTDPNGHTTYRSYDSLGNPLTVSDGLGRTTSYEYNTFNEPTAITDPKGVATTMSYDSKGNLLSTSTPLIGSSPAQNQVTSYTYGDSAHPGDVTAMTDADSKAWSYTYDTYGDRSTSTDPLSDATLTCYDGVGRRTSLTTPKGTAAGVTCASSPPAANTTYFQFNAFGDVTQVTDPLGHVTKQSYDPDRNVSSATDGDSNTTNYSYDADNRLTTVTRADRTVLVTDYNSDGTVRDQKDGRNITTATYAYDSLARESSVTDGLNNVTSFSYDAAGNRTSQQDPGGNCSATPATGCTTFGYDAANELTGVTYSDGATPNLSNVTYDGDGQRTGMTDGTGTSSWTFDSLHRMTSYKDGHGDQLQYAYNLRNLATTITYPGSLNVTRGYDNAGRLTNVQDWLSNTTTFGYDANSNLTTETLPSAAGVVDTFTFDAADHLSGVSDAKGVTNLFSATYNRDGANQVTSDSSAPPTVSSYKYTALNQLCYAGAANTTACSLPPPASTAYAYDAGDNITQVGGTDQAFNNADELCWSASTSGTCTSPPTGATTYTYDTRGNRTKVIPPTGTPTTLGYDQANRLTSYAASSTTTYAYDGDGLRMSKTAGTTTTQYLWDLSSSLPLIAKDGTIAYVTGPGGLPLEQINGSTALWIHHAQLGSTRLMTDSTGTSQATYAYDSDGNLTASSGTATTPVLYAGQYRDAESGFYLMGARYYDPSTAQWLSRDPMVATTRQPYAYVADDPLNATDPSGLCPFLVPQSVCDAAGAAVGAVGHAASAVASGVSTAAQAAGSWVVEHRDGILTGVGAAAGVVALATGVGALADASILGIEASGLGTISTAAGAVGGLADLPGCISGSAARCVGAAGNAVGFGLGIGSAFAGAESLAAGVTSSVGFAVGLGSLAWDSLTAEAATLTSPC